MAADENNEQMEKDNRRKRSIALAVALGLLAVVFYTLTIVKMGPGLFDRTL